MRTHARIMLVSTASLILVTLFLLTLNAHAGQPLQSSPELASLTSAGTYGGTFRFSANEPSTLDPAATGWGDEPQGPIVTQIFEGLTKLDDSLTPRPAIASSWESSDAQHWTFHIRQDAYFHNGRQVTADDVVYSWNRVVGAGNEWYTYLMQPLLDSVTAADADTVAVTLTEPFAPFPTLLAWPAMSIVPSETVGTISTAPVGAGPFQFQNWTASDSIDLAHFGNYYAGRPYLDGITFRFYTDTAAMYDDYELGNLDLSPVPDAEIDSVVGDPNAIFTTDLVMRGFWMKVDWPPFDDVRVRQALNYAVARQDILENVIPQYWEVADGPVPLGMQAYDPPVPNYPYSPTLALDLLAQAGWTDTDSDGILDDGAGTDLAFEIWHPTGSHADNVNAMADDFRDIGGTGIGTTVVVSSADWSTEYLPNKNQYPMLYMGWGADYAAPYNFLYPLFHSDSGFWQDVSHYNNAHVDSWIEQSKSTLDSTTRQALYEKAEQQIQKDAPGVNMYYGGSVYVQSDNVVGLVVTPMGSKMVQMENVQLVYETHDLAVESILHPKESVPVEEMTPTVKVRNAGSASETNVPVRCRILQNSTVEYNQTETIASLSPFAVTVVKFPSWTPPAAGDYTVECTTQLAGDENTANDKETKPTSVTDVAFYDVYIGDNLTDIGATPTEQWWESPDIIVRNQDDGIRRHQDPILGQTNYVYVRVKNIGSTTMDAGIGVYWHEPATAIRCGGWAPIAGPLPTGTLAPGESSWIKTTWVPPIEGHTCLFAVVSSEDDPMTYECDVPWDNNLAQRNVDIVALEQENEGLQALAATGEATVQFEVTNVRDVPASVDLIIERGTFPPTGTLAVEFSHDLFDRWQDDGGTVTGGAVIPNTTQLAITDATQATIAGLPMKTRETQHATLLLQGAPASEFELRVSERIDGVTIGGLTYQTEIPWLNYMPIILK